MRKITKNRHKRAKQAMSEVMGAVLLIGVTLAVGFAAWAWASGAARNAESNLNSTITENFVIVDANFSTSNGKLATMMFYTTGGGSVYINTIVVQNSSWTYNNSTLAQTNGPNCRKCAALSGQSLTLITLNLATNLTPGSLYTFKAVGQYGTVVQYQQVR